MTTKKNLVGRRGFPARRRRGRPSRADATAKVEKALAALGLDPANLDPRAVLAAIAADVSAPASARVAACKCLLAHQQPAGEPDKPGDGAPPDALTQRALQILGRLQ